MGRPTDKLENNWNCILQILPSYFYVTCTKNILLMLVEYENIFGNF